ncbi:spondin-2 isoform X2 [Bombyx mori]|uniref:Spondin-1 n=2 Tax=Bombyx mori TaxID=7091 RepID=A0A8R2C8M7_BOMMO|nr:spondin-2 isoform X1 [Bombyx mori]
MLLKCLLLLSLAVSQAFGLMGKCDHTPPLATVNTPLENRGYYVFNIENAVQKEGNLYYTPDQTYVLTVTSRENSRPFRWFMITAEDPAVDNNIYDFGRKFADVGSLKTLDTDWRSRYSERCQNTVENADNSAKTQVEVHWVSPKHSENQQQVRIRAMVAENKEAWYTGNNLTILLHMDDQRPRDSPPLPIRDECNLCSEARYEVIFNGRWSRLAHPRHYPSKPDENGYTHMIGASHGNNFTLWLQGTNAGPGLVDLVVKPTPTTLEREIIDAMVLDGGTRTLIRGKKHDHPFMSKPSHSLFRVDRTHHMFSIIVGMTPSPDWFLGTSKFELCDEDGWLEKFDLPLYPWDAGIVDGVSYESPKSMSQPVDNIERVEIGSFDRDSPFYQMNLNDLAPFAILQVRRLDVYPLIGIDCSEGQNAEEELQQDAPVLEPVLAESRQSLLGESCAGEWGEWTPCTPHAGVCGPGLRTRTRYIQNIDLYVNYKVSKSGKGEQEFSSCKNNKDSKATERKECFVRC